MGKLTKYIGIGLCLGIGYKLSGFVYNVSEKILADELYFHSSYVRDFIRTNHPEIADKQDERYNKHLVRCDKAIMNEDLILCDSYNDALVVMDKIKDHFNRVGHVSYHYIRKLAGCSDNPIENNKFGWGNIDGFKIMEQNGVHIIYIPTYAYKFEEV